ncbi:hypothetical protein [Streptomyces sp. NPDC007346]|uniref:hypothetical protein n=1 Tax=Streptomyces sp. NPDC007346 TaxID=3154682 RepID=UPI0034533706
MPDGTDEWIMSEVSQVFGPQSGEAKTMSILLDYRRMYGPKIPTVAARHLDQILARNEIAAEFATAVGVTPDEAEESMHSLHAQGLLLVADDGSLWLTVPPGTPYSAPDGDWAFVEKKLDPPRKEIPTS